MRNLVLVALLLLGIGTLGFGVFVSYSVLKLERIDQKLVGPADVKVTDPVSLSGKVQVMPPTSWSAVITRRSNGDQVTVTVTQQAGETVDAARARFFAECEAVRNS